MKKSPEKIKTPEGGKEAPVSVLEREKINELFFNQYIETGMEAELFNQLKIGGFTPEEVIELRKSFSELSDMEKEYAYAFPYELRKRNFSHQSKTIHEGVRDMGDFWKVIVDLGERTGRRLGYHCSPYDIQPTFEKDGHGKAVESWIISGTEQDHRNNDVPMAYYSEDYKNIYRQKEGRYLYVISSQRAPGSAHYVDNSNRWGRASKLSVVQRFDLREVDKFVQEQSQEYFKQKNTSK